jgi:hypothetical protein
MTDSYVRPALTVDRSSVAADIYERIAELAPGTAIEPTHPAGVIIEAFADWIAQALEQGSEVGDYIFRRLGTWLFRYPALEATQATGFTTWVFTDPAEYLIEAGTPLTLLAPDGSRIDFQVRASVLKPAATLSTAIGEVEIIATDPGADGTGLSTGALLERPLISIDTITVEAPTTGGVDAEGDAEYLDRLKAYLANRQDTLVLPRNFEIDAVIATPQVDRALALNLYLAGINEIQQINVANATGGTATYTFEGQTTTAVGSTANAATFQAALEALSNIAPGDVLVTGGPFNTAPMFVEFKGALANSNRTQMTFTSSLTGGSASVTISTTQGGQAASPTTQGHISVAVVNSDGADPGSTIRDAGEARQQAMAMAGLVIDWISATYTTLTVVFTGVSDADFDPADVETRAETALADYISPANWGLPSTGDQRSWRDKPVVRFQDLSTVLNGVEGFDHWTTLTLNGGTADVTMTGPAALPAPAPTSTVTGTVTAP